MFVVVLLFWCSSLPHEQVFTVMSLLAIFVFQIYFSSVANSRVEGGGGVACSFGLSATSQQYFSLRTNQPAATSQEYFSLTTNQHQPPAKRTVAPPTTGASMEVPPESPLEIGGGRIGKRGSEEEGSSSSMLHSWLPHCFSFT
jgi:hypothetical protein